MCVLSIVCETGTYGFDCNETCGHCRDVNQCMHSDGLCLTGCDNGYQGTLCQTRMSNANNYNKCWYLDFDIL